MTRNSLPVSTCQKVQPLQLGAPCTPAPTLWIDPAGWPSQSRLPSTRTFDFQRRFVSVSTVPGPISPHSTTLPNATRVAAFGAIILFPPPHTTGTLLWNPPNSEAHSVGKQNLGN